MPIQNSTSKSVTANTWTQLGTANYPSVPGTVILSSSEALLVGPTNADASSWIYAIGSAQPVQIYVPDIASVWVKCGFTTTVYVSYYPASETPVPMR